MQQTSYPLMSISLSSFKFAMECDARLKHLHFAFKLEYSMPKRDSPEQRTRTKLILNFHFPDFSQLSSTFSSLVPLCFCVLEPQTKAYSFSKEDLPKAVKWNAPSHFAKFHHLLLNLIAT